MTQRNKLGETMKSHFPEYDKMTDAQRKAELLKMYTEALDTIEKQKKEIAELKKKD